MLIFRGISLQETEDPRTSRFWFDIHEGVPGHESPEVRGEDVIAPGREGRYVGNRVYDRQELLLEGFIRGAGATPEERTADWHALSQTILAAFAMDLSPGTLEVEPGTIPYLGLTGATSIACRTIEQMSGDIRSFMSYQAWSFKLEAIKSNDEWWTPEESS